MQAHIEYTDRQGRLSSRKVSFIDVIAGEDTEQLNPTHAVPLLRGYCHLRGAMRSFDPRFIRFVPPS